MRPGAVIACIACAACGRIGFETADDGNGSLAPIAWWKLDETSGTIAADSVGSLDGTLVAGTWVAVTGGPVTRAFSLDGSGTGIDLGTPARLANLPALTVVAWLRPAQLVADGNSHCFFDKGDDGGPIAGWAFDASHDVAGDLLFEVFYAPGQTVSRTTTGGDLAVGTWSRVAATWDGSATGSGIHIYIGGGERDYATMTSASGNARPDDAVVPAGIGCIASTGFAGEIADVRIYDRALTPAQLAGL